MEALRELFRIVFLALSLSADEIRTLGAKTHKQLSRVRMSGIRRLRNWAVLSVTLWLIALIVGIGTQDTVWFAIAGTIILVPLLFLLTSAQALIAIIQVVYTVFGDWEESSAQAAAEKIIGVVSSVFFFCTLVSLYCLFVPVYNHPYHVFVLAFVGILLIGFGVLDSKRPQQWMGNLSWVAALILFIGVTLAMIMPRSVVATQKAVVSFDHWVADLFGDEPPPVEVHNGFPRDGVDGWRVLHLRSDSYDRIVNTGIWVDPDQRIEVQAYGSIWYELEYFKDRWWFFDSWEYAGVVSSPSPHGTKKVNLPSSVQQCQFLENGNDLAFEAVFTVRDPAQTNQSRWYAPILHDEGRSWSAFRGGSKPGYIYLSIDGAIPKGNRISRQNGYYAVAIRVLSD